MRANSIVRFAALLLALGLFGCVKTGQAPQTVATASDRPAYTYWPQDVSDLRPDPAVRYGVLPNGMHYALMRNTQPAGTIALRLRIATGALQERDEQQGLAHFIEHMAFNGSKNVPEGEFVKLLQRKGLAFGADTNASTNTDETIYKLDLPKNDDDLIDTGFMLFREISDRLSFDPAAIEREKGVVLSEERTRNTPDYRALVTRWHLSYEGQRRANRLAIGTVETIKGATRELLLDYYTHFYRPERALLVATGDFDPVQLEAKIKAKFSDWQGAGTDPHDPEEGPIKQRGLTTASYVEANLPESVSVSWTQPPDDRPDTAAVRAENVKRELALNIVSRRLIRIQREANAPFIGAGIGYSNQHGVSQGIGFGLLTRPGTWRKGLASVEQEYRRALQYGFSESEVTREVKEWRAQLEDEVAKTKTRETRPLADQLATTFGDRDVFTAPADQLARFNALAPSLTPEQLLAALRASVGGQGPLIFVASSQPIAGKEAEIAQVYSDSLATKVEPTVKEAAKTFPYVDFGKPTAVAERSDVADLGFTMVRFANGVTLNVKQTSFEKDSIKVGVRIGGGFLQLPKDKVGLGFALGFQVLTEGGLKKLTEDELEEALAGRIVSNSQFSSDDAFVFLGETNKRDLTLQMQLFAAFTTDAAYRQAALEQKQALAETILKQQRSSPDNVLRFEAGGIIRSGDPRAKLPTVADIKALKMSDFQTVLEPSFKSAPIEITIVGDTTADEAIQAVAATFGALPPHAAKFNAPPGSADVRFPAKPLSVRLTHEGRADQAAAYIAWAAPDFYSNPRRARTISLMREVMKVRLIEEFREAQGATYSPSASSANSQVFPGFGLIAAQAATRPDLVEGFYKTVDKIVAEVKAGSFSDDVLTRARTPLIDQIETARRGNDYWLNAIGDAHKEPRSVEAIRSLMGDLKGISKAEIVAAANQYLTKSRQVEIRVLPASAADSTESGAKRAKQPVREATAQ